MEERVTVLVYISQCFMKNKCMKFEANPLRDGRVSEMLQFCLNANCGRQRRRRGEDISSPYSSNSRAKKGLDPSLAPTVTDPLNKHKIEMAPPKDNFYQIWLKSTQYLQ